VLGAIIATGMPKFFVTHPTLADQIRPVKQTVIGTEQKLIIFQQSQVKQRKWDLEDTIDLQSTGATQRQQGRLQELIIELQILQTRYETLEMDMKACK
jgi:hypothetical protein